VLLGHMQSLGKQLDVYQLWKHMRPPEWMKRFADTANTQLDGASLDPNYRLTDSAECEVVLGLALAACVHGSGPFDSFFSNSADASGLFPSPGFGRHGVNKNRALILLRVMHLSHGPEQPGADPHWFIDGPLRDSKVVRGTTFGCRPRGPNKNFYFANGGCCGAG